MKPLPTQTEDAAFLAASPRLRGSMFSAPGTGKTITALEAVRLLNLPGQWCVLAPPIALRMWGNTITEHLGATAQVIRSAKDSLDMSADFYVVSYGMVGAFPHLRECVGGIADEADALKTLSAQRTVEVYGSRASAKNCLIEKMEAFFPLTGTPIRRYADDLYPWFRALHLSVLKGQGITSMKKFQEAFCVTQLRRFHPRMPLQPQVIGNKNERLLNNLIYGQSNVIYRPALARRRLIDDVAEHMPPMAERDIMVEYDDSAELREASNLIDFEEESEGALSTARRLLGLAKAPYVAGYLLDVMREQNGPVLGLYWHREVKDAIVAAIRHHRPEARVEVIDGRTSTRDRETFEDQFNFGSIDLLLGQIQSMGVSLNLQKGSNRAVFAERDWSPSSQEQGYKRVWRLGQESKVLVDYCLADHPIEEAVTSVTSRKQKSNSNIIG